MIKIFTCAECGNVFETNKTGSYVKKYCSNECKKEALDRMKAWKKKLSDQKEKSVEGKNIDQICAKAKNSGTTYGKMVAEEYKKKVKVEFDAKVRSGYRLAKDNKRN